MVDLEVRAAFRA